MIAVVGLFQPLVTLILADAVSLSHLSNLTIKTIPDFLLRDAAEFHIAIIHRHVRQIVQVTEHTDLRELCHSVKKPNCTCSSIGFNMP